MSIDQKFLIRALAEWNVGGERKDNGTAVGELAVFMKLLKLIRMREIYLNLTLRK